MMRLRLEYTDLGFLPRCETSRNLAGVYDVKIFSANQIRNLLKKRVEIKLVLGDYGLYPLLEWRKLQRLTQAQAAKRFNVALVTFAGWERGTANTPQRVLDEIKPTL